MIKLYQLMDLKLNSLLTSIVSYFQQMLNIQYQLQRKQKYQQMLAIKMKKTDALAKCLLSIFEKRLSWSLRRLCVFQEDSQNQQTVRHYDLDCEAIQTLSSLLQRQIQNYRIKFFLKLKIDNTAKHRRINSTKYLSVNSQNKFYNLSNVKSEVNLSVSDGRQGKTIREYEKRIREILWKVKAINNNPEFNLSVKLNQGRKSGEKEVEINSNRKFPDISIISPADSSSSAMGKFWRKQVYVNSPSFSKEN